MGTYYVAGIPYSDELFHHQVKGAKHGVRRYQNFDGSYTALGRLHYGIGSPREPGRHVSQPMIKRNYFSKTGPRDQLKSNAGSVKIKKSSPGVVEFLTGRKSKAELDKARSEPKHSDHGIADDLRRYGDSKHKEGVTLSGEADRHRSDASRYAEDSRRLYSESRDQRNAANSKNDRISSSEKRLAAFENDSKRLASKIEAKQAELDRNLKFSNIAKNAGDSEHNRGYNVNAAKNYAASAKGSRQAAENARELKLLKTQYERAKSIEKNERANLARERAQQASANIRADRAAKEARSASRQSSDSLSKYNTAKKESQSKFSEWTTSHKNATDLERRTSIKEAGRLYNIQKAEQAYAKTLPGMANALANTMQEQYEELIKKIDNPETKKKIKKAKNKVFTEMTKTGVKSYAWAVNQANSMITSIKNFFGKLFG